MPWSPLSPLSPLKSGSPFNSVLFKLSVYVLPYSPPSFSVILIPDSAFNTSFKEATVNTGLVVDVAPSPLPPVVNVNCPLSFPPKVIFIVGLAKLTPVKVGVLSNPMRKIESVGSL